MAGSKEEFEKIYRRYFNDVFLFLKKLSKDEGLAEEITSETFFKAMRSIDAFRGDTDIRVWLCQIAKNCYFSHLKKQQGLVDIDDIEFADNIDIIEEQIINRSDAMRIHLLLHNLAEPYKEVFMLRVFGELSFKQIAKILKKQITGPVSLITGQETKYWNKWRPIMSDKCNLIKDILPLYVEDMVSADTREFVSEHLEHCAECHAEFERMQKATKFIPDTDPDTDIVPLKRVKRDLFIKRLQTICFTAILACAIVTIVFGILTSPKFFPYSDNLLNVIDVPDRSVIITFDSEVTGYSCNEVFDNETETAIYRINAWTTTWDLHLSNRGKQNMVIPFDRETEIQIFYAQNDGSEDVLIYGANQNTEENGVTLPRLILMPYFLLAFLALVVLAILRVLLRNKQAIVVWVDRAIPFPISYMAAQLCTKGFNFTTYSSQRDFCIIILVAMLLYFAMLTGKSLYKAKLNTSRG